MGALSKLYRENSRTVDLYDHAAAILIFPRSIKLGPVWHCKPPLESFF